MIKISSQAKSENAGVNGQNNAIDLVKFICSILVVTIHVEPLGLAHTTGISGLCNYFIRNYIARLAVPFFFISSGYFLYRKTSLNEFDIQAPKKYALKMLRLYLIWSVIFFPINLTLFSRDKSGLKHAVYIYIRNFIISGSYRHLWYLNATFFAVVLISVLLYKHIAPKKILIAASILYFIGLFAQSWFGFIKPLSEVAPRVWVILKFIIEEVIVTTRDGLFEGFLFIGIGMIFAFYEITMSKKQAIAGFVISMLLLFAEVFTLKHFNMARENDMYFFLVPATFFMFYVVREAKLPDSAVYKKLRILSSLIFFIHPWVSEITLKVLEATNKKLTQTCLWFILTLFATLICAVIIIKISEASRFKWVKKIYA